MYVCIHACMYACISNFLKLQTGHFFVLTAEQCFSICSNVHNVLHKNLHFIPLSLFTTTILNHCCNQCCMSMTCLFCMEECCFLNLCFTHSVIHYMHLYSTSSRGGYSEVLPTSARPIEPP